MPLPIRFAAGLLVCVLLTAGAAEAPAASSPAISKQMQSAIDTAARKELRAFGGGAPIPGVFVALYIPGKAPYVKSIGYADTATRAPFALSDKFRIGSNTKTFVITVLLQLQDEHKLSFDDPISKFPIGVRVPNGRNITLRQLAEMRSGLFEAYNTPQINKMNITPQTRFDPRTLVRWAVQQKPLFAPGAKYNYCNTNYILLGLVIEAVTHDAVQNQIRKRLLAPMGLTDTSFPTTDPNMPQPYAHGYGLDAKGNWTDVSQTIPPSLTWAAGAMVSTVPDMKRWVKSYVLGTMNSKASQRDRLRCLPTGGKDLSFGLGIGCSNGWYGYTGGLPGYNTAAYYLPSKGVTLIAFVTAQREEPSPGVANAIARDIAQVITPSNVLFPK